MMIFYTNIETNVIEMITDEVIDDTTNLTAYEVEDIPAYWGVGWYKYTQENGLEYTERGLQKIVEEYNLSNEKIYYKQDLELMQAKARKSSEIAYAYETAIKAGLEVNGIVYPIHDKAVEQLNVLLNNFTAQKQLDTYNGTDTKYLIDNDYDTQEVTKDDYLTAIMQIIDYREQLHFNRASKLSAIESATTIEQVNNIGF